tara:strand:- start:206 stop:766 length:561 start_codon:yes stop_codon:yes gene_type:complete
MKKILLVLVAVLAFGTSNAQEKYGTFKSGSISSSIDVETEKVYLNLNEKGDYGLILTKSSRTAFVAFLTQSRVKFLEWSGKAVENGVKDMNKDISKINIKGVFKYGSWQFGTSPLRTLFYVNKDGSTTMYLYGSKMTSSTNRYIKSGSAMVNLTSDEDFNSLVTLISDDVIDSFINKKNKSDNLFN